MRSTQNGFSQARESIASMIRQEQSRRQLEKPPRIDHILPIRLTAIQRRLYHTLLYEMADVIESFCNSPSEVTTNRAAISALMESLRNVALHPLLVADAMPETQMSRSDEAWYLTQSASKFELIVDVLEDLKTQDVRVAIICDQDRVRQIWMTILKGLDLTFVSSEQELLQHSTQETASAGLLVALLPSDQDAISNKSFDLAFILEGQARLDNAPNLVLIANYSVEHVLQQVTDPITQISTIARFAESVGICTQDTGALAQKIVNLVCGMPFEPEVLEDISLSSSQYDEVSYEASADGQPASKRQRYGDNLSSQPPPQIVVTKINGLEVHTEAQTPLHMVSIVNKGNDHSVQSSEILPEQPSLQTQFISPAHLEKTPSQPYAADTKQIFSKPSAEQARIIALEEDIDRILLRFDDLREECRELAEQKEAACAQAAALQKRFERAIEESRAAKQEKNELKTELDRLKMPALPEESSPDHLSVENLRLKTEIEKLKKSAESKAQDFEFVRQQYQQASSAAAESSSEIADLKAQLASYRNKNDGGLGYKLILQKAEASEAALREEAENLTLRNNVLIEQLKRMREERLSGRGRGDNRRELVVNQDRKRATSASAEVGQRKKIDKVGTSRLSVASLISPTSDKSSQAFDPTSSPRATLHQMLRGQSQDTRSFGRERVPAKRPRTPMA